MLKLERSGISVVGRFLGRAVVELENLALPHQLHALRCQRLGGLRQPVSLRRINSIAISRSRSNSVQMEFLVVTGVETVGEPFVGFGEHRARIVAFALLSEERLRPRFGFSESLP